MAFTNEQMSNVILLLIRERVRIYEYERSEELGLDGELAVQTIFRRLQAELGLDKLQQAAIHVDYDHYSRQWTVHLKWPGKDESVLECVFCGELNTTARETCEDCGRPLT